MITFPALKTSAVAQYPARRTLHYQNQVLRFVDGSEQRYRDSAGPLHRWEIALNELDEGELAAVESFFADAQGAFANFAFTDPWDGTVYQNCSLEADGMEARSLAEMRGATSLAVVENRA